MFLRPNRNRWKKTKLVLGRAPRYLLCPDWRSCSFCPIATRTPGGFESPVSLTPGFQKSSANTTRSAEVKVRPMLAAVMDSTATACFSNSWNCWHRSSRSAEEVEPSMWMCGTCCRDKDGKRGGLHQCLGARQPRLRGQSHAAVLTQITGLSLLSQLLVFLFHIEFCVDGIVDAH